MMRGEAIGREKTVTAAIMSVLFYILFLLALLVVLRSDAQGAHWVEYYSNGNKLCYYDTDNMIYSPDGYFRAFTKVIAGGGDTGKLAVMDVDCKKNTVRTIYHSVTTKEGRPRLVESASVEWRTIGPDTVDSGFKEAVCP